MTKEQLEDLKVGMDQPDQPTDTEINSYMRDGEDLNKKEATDDPYNVDPIQEKLSWKDIKALKK